MAFVNLNQAREKDQRAAMDRISQGGFCPFCREHFQKEHKKPILFETEHWLLTENQWPYENTAIHLLAVLLRHEETVDHLTDEEWAGLGKLLKWTTAHFKIPGGALAIRFGESRFSGSSVQHLHVQIIVPRTDENTGLPAQVALWIGSRPKA